VRKEIEIDSIEETILSFNNFYFKKFLSLDFLNDEIFEKRFRYYQ